MKNIYVFILFIVLFYDVNAQITSKIKIIYKQINCSIEIEIIYTNDSNRPIQLDNKGQIQIEKFSPVKGKYVKVTRPNKMFDSFDTHPIFSFWEIRNNEYLDFKKDSTQITNYVKSNFPNLNDSLCIVLGRQIFVDINRPLILHPKSKVVVRDNISPYLVDSGNYRLKLVFKKYNFDYLLANNFIEELGIKDKILSSSFYNPNKNCKKCKILNSDYIYINVE